MRDAPPPTMGRYLWLASASLIGCSFPSTQSACATDPAICFDAGIKPIEPGALGKDCTRDADCRGSLRLSCMEGRCAFASDLAEGDACRVTNECGDRLFCDLDGDSARCRAAGAGAENTPCDSTATCQRRLVCGHSDVGLRKRCLTSGDGDVGSACTTLRECLAGLTCAAADDASGRCALATPGSVGLSPGFPGVRCGPEAPTPTAYFRVPRADAGADFFRLPFPNDVRRSAAGLDLSGFPTPGDALGIGADVLERYRSASQGLTGFSTSPVVYFRFSSPYSGVNDKSVLLYDVTPGSPDYGTAQSRSWGTSSGAVTQYVCPNWLNVRSREGSPLRPGTTYAVLLTRDIKPRAGGDYARDGDLDALLSEATPNDAALAHAHTAYAPLRSFLKDATLTHGLRSESLLNASVFTTQDPTALARAVFDDVRRAEVPRIRDVSSCGIGGDAGCAVEGESPCVAADGPYVELQGRINLPIYQSGTSPYAREGGGIALDAEGKALATRREDVCFTLALPKTDLPTKGFPLIIYGHGTGGSHRSALADFATLADHAALLSIDLPLHGTRKAGSALGSDELFFNVLNPEAALGNVLQGSADLLSLVRWAMATDLPETGSLGRAVRFDTARIALFGHSQGATHVSLLVPYAPEAAGFVISGVGGHVSSALVGKRSPVDLAAFTPLLLGDPEAGPSGSCPACIGANHPAYALMQTYLDRADPLNFGRIASATRSRPANVFMTFGVGDSYSPDATQRAYVLSAGLPLVAPELVPVDQNGALAAPVALNVGGVATQGVRQYSAAPGTDAHFVYRSSARDDVERFLRALLEGANPTIGD